MFIDNMIIIWIYLYILIFLNDLILIIIIILIWHLSTKERWLKVVIINCMLFHLVKLLFSNS